MAAAALAVSAVFATVTVFATLDFAAGLGLEAADAFGDAVDGDLAMYSPTPRFEQSRQEQKRPDACLVVAIRNDTGV
ncbi:hypothetical protein [Brevundimonas sp. LM2]|uniref:hypothetical protein n=1 Tax=Brevundimonas sp. LM2 TaxID=1938605 RepID=UPI0012378057|nr:hypothetical protein [Brevundimonas sp. LM2]